MTDRPRLTFASLGCYVRLRRCLHVRHLSFASTHHTTVRQVNFEADNESDSTEPVLEENLDGGQGGVDDDLSTDHDVHDAGVRLAALRLPITITYDTHGTSNSAVLACQLK